MLNDQEVLDAIQAKDHKKVLNILYIETLKPIIHFVTSNGGTKEDGEKCFQEAVVRLIMAVRRRKVQPGVSIENYLEGTVRSLWLTEAERQGVQVDDSDFASMQVTLSEPFLEKERAQDLKNMVDTMGDRCGRILSLFLLEGKVCREVKAEMELASEEMVKVIYYRCKRKLREKIDRSPAVQSLFEE